MPRRKFASRPTRLSARWLAALLCLIASLAYATRDAGPLRTTAQIGMAMPAPGMPKAGEHAHPAPTTPHPEHDGHPAGHCPFCFTGAFALEAADVPLLGQLSVRALRAPPARICAQALTARHANARAPPCFIA